MTRRIERAKASSRRGDSSVTDVCFAVGCSSSGTFSTRFTELVGVPPSVYRRRAAESDAGSPAPAESRTAAAAGTAHGAAPGASSGTASAADADAVPGAERSDGSPACVARRVTRPVRNREAQAGRRFSPQTDPDASLAFYRDVLGFEVRNDVGYEGMRWITVGPADQPDTAIVSHPPAATPSLNDDDKRALSEIVAKGAYFGVNLATPDVDETFARIEAAGAEVVQEPIDQPYGVRDCAFRDPAGNEIRIQQRS
ncbi:hypothetical protein OY671_001377 [Metschnikowia pulcherrima]|nr:hypothetical protein OY671_001377 [Metschnikowia pulcherrima]